MPTFNQVILFTDNDGFAKFREEALPMPEGNPQAMLSKLQPSGGFQGQASDIDIHARDVMETKDRLNRILAHHTGQSVEQVKADSDRDNFMNPEAARTYGLIDKVLAKREVAPAITPGAPA